MLIYNTTYQVELAEARNLVIWLSECYIPQVEENGKLSHPTHLTDTTTFIRAATEMKRLPIIVHHQPQTEL